MFSWYHVNLKRLQHIKDAQSKMWRFNKLDLFQTGSTKFFLQYLKTMNFFLLGHTGSAPNRNQKLLFRKSSFSRWAQRLKYFCKLQNHIIWLLKILRKLKIILFWLIKLYDGSMFLFGPKVPIWCVSIGSKSSYRFQ